jgi:hypothetical protein
MAIKIIILCTIFAPFIVKGVYELTNGGEVENAFLYLHTGYVNRRTDGFSIH